MSTTSQWERQRLPDDEVNEKEKREKNCRQKVKWVRTCATNSRHWTRHTCNVCTQKNAINLLLLSSLVQRSEYLFRCVYYVIFLLLCILHTQYEYHQRRFVYAAPSTFRRSVAMHLSRSLCQSYLLFITYFYIFAFKTFQISYCHHVYVSVCV